MTRAAMQQALDAIDRRFQSMNSVPVDKAVVPACEWAALRAAFEQPDEVPEGCTPVDAGVLREANHALAMELHEAQAELAQQGEPVAWQWGSTDCVIPAMSGYTPPRGQEWRPLYTATQPAAVAQPAPTSMADQLKAVLKSDGTWFCAETALSAIQGRIRVLISDCASTNPEPVAQPLTDEKIDAIGAEIFDVGSLDDTEIKSNRELARAVERAHKIGGAA